MNAPVAPPPDAPMQSERSDRWLTMLDAWLDDLRDDDERRLCLDALLSGWGHRYQRFVATGGESEYSRYPNDPPQAADFLLTIAGISKRLLKLKEAPCG